MGYRGKGEKRRSLYPVEVPALLLLLALGSVTSLTDPHHRVFPTAAAESGPFFALLDRPGVAAMGVGAGRSAGTTTAVDRTAATTANPLSLSLARGRVSRRGVSDRVQSAAHHHVPSAGLPAVGGDEAHPARLVAAPSSRSTFGPTAASTASPARQGAGGVGSAFTTGHALLAVAMVVAVVVVVVVVVAVAVAVSVALVGGLLGSEHVAEAVAVDVAELHEAAGTDVQGG